MLGGGGATKEGGGGLPGGGGQDCGGDVLGCGIQRGGESSGGTESSEGARPMGGETPGPEGGGMLEAGGGGRGGGCQGRQLQYPQSLLQLQELEEGLCLAKASNFLFLCLFFTCCSLQCWNGLLMPGVHE